MRPLNGDSNKQINKQKQQTNNQSVSQKYYDGSEPRL